MATRENSPSDRLCQIVPVKRPSMKVSVAIGGSVKARERIVGLPEK
ncbi:MAG: hypothetical protein ABSE93_29815 [Terriglobia bacterium]|jgi:hypothetical protein